MKRMLVFALCAMGALSACKKDTNSSPSDPLNPSNPAALSVSRSVLPVSTFAGFTDTFSVQSNLDWSITLSAGLSSWARLDTMKGGSGNTVIKVTISKDATASQTGTITVSPVTTNTTVSPQVITVKQQLYSLAWQKAYSTGSVDGILQDTDGGFVFSGSSGAGLIFKTDANGNKLWSTSLASTSGDLYSVAKTADGGYVATGWKNPTTSTDTVGQELAIAKFSASGSLVWEKYFGGSDNENGFKVITTTDGGYLVSGLTYSSNGDVSVARGYGDMWLLKVDANGKKVWEKTFGGSYYDYEAYVTATADGGYLLTGGSSSTDGDISGSHGHSEVVVFKLDASGNKVWTKVFGGSQSDSPAGIITTKDGGSVIVGYTNSNDGDVSGLHGSDEDMWVLKLDSKGQKTWQATLGSTGWEEGASITEMPDGSFMALSFTYGNNGDVDGNHGDKDFWVVNLSSSGKKMWQRPVGGPGYDGPDAVLATPDGGFIMSGSASYNGGDVTGVVTYGQGWVVKFK